MIKYNTSCSHCAQPICPRGSSNLLPWWSIQNCLQMLWTVCFCKVTAAKPMHYKIIRSMGAQLCWDGCRKVGGREKPVAEQIIHFGPCSLSVSSRGLYSRGQQEAEMKLCALLTPSSRGHHRIISASGSKCTNFSPFLFICLFYLGRQHS